MNVEKGYTIKCDECGTVATDADLKSVFVDATIKTTFTCSNPECKKATEWNIAL